MFSSTAINRGGMYVPPPAAQPKTMSPFDLAERAPNWKPAIAAACTSMASLQLNGRHVGGAIFVGDGIALAPLHALMPYQQPIGGAALQHLIQSLTVNFTSIDLDRMVSCVPENCEVYGVAEQFPRDDFCLLSCKGPKAFCGYPSCAYSLPSQCLFAQFDPQGALTVSIVQSCPAQFWEGGYCAYSPTRAGSSGGCYFDMSGALIAVHLSRSNGTCGLDSGQERKGILAKDMVRCSEVLAHLQTICWASPDLTLESVLYPPIADRCYTKETSVNGRVASPDYTCDYAEVSRGKQRSIRFTLRHNVLRTVVNAEYTLRCQNGKHTLNVHDSGVYSGHEAGLYAAAAHAFLNSVIQLNGARPLSFECDYRKKQFVANFDDRG